MYYISFSGWSLSKLIQISIYFKMLYIKPTFSELTENMVGKLVESIIKVRLMRNKVFHRHVTILFLPIGIQELRLVHGFGKKTQCMHT